MVLKRIGVLSCGKITGLVYAAIGLIAGGFMALFSLFGAALGGAASEMETLFFGAFFGIGAIIFMPVMYGLMGFLVGLLGALIYNGAAKLLGGVELELE